MATFDAEAHAKLDRLVATQDEHTARFGDLESVVMEVVSVVAGLAEPLRALRESVEQLAEAAGENDGTGDELGQTLRAIFGELKKQTIAMTAIGEGLERLPSIMEDTAINAAELVTGGGAGPLPEVS